MSNELQNMTNMETKPIFNEDIHFEHQQWQRELDFWEDEIKIFKNRLADIIHRSDEKGFLSTLDHFENRFRIHHTKIEGFKQRIHAHELNMSKHYEVGENSMDRVLYDYHKDFREQIQTEREMYNELKKEFYEFMTQFV